MTFNELLEVLTSLVQKVKEHAENTQWNDMSLWVTITATIAVIAITALHFTYKRMKIPAIRIPELEQNRQQNRRFRKRDKVRFFARKVLRKGRDAATKLQRQASAIKEGVVTPEYSRSGRRLRKRERMLILAKRMFQVRQEPPKLLKKELPPSVLEADLVEEQKPNLPDEVMYLLRSVKVFGQFEKGIFLQLCRHMEILKVEKGKYLFRVGDPDEFMYVVQEGQINLYICEDSLEVKLSEFTTGESLHSLFSILDVLTGHPAPYKTVFARAVEDSSVIRLPVDAFNVAFENRQDALVQMVQVVMTRMQRVTFLALHNYLGLSRELLKGAKSTDGEKLSVHRLVQSRESLLGCRPSLENASEEPEAFDEPDAAALMTPVEKFLPKVKSEPVLRQDLSKKLRFEKFETVVDDKDNVFQREVGVPLGAKMEKEMEILSTEAASASTKSHDREGGAEQRARSLSMPYGSRRPSSIDSLGYRNSVTVLNEPEILELVMSDMLELFGFHDEEMLSSKITLLRVPEGFELIQEGDQDVSMYFVVFGALCIYQEMQDIDICGETQSVTLFHAYPGMLTGQLAVLTGEPSFFSVKADKDSVVAKLKRKDFYSIMRHYPRMVLNTAHTVVQRASGFTRQIDFALDWTMVEAGKALYKQDTQSDCMYIVLHGRLRSVHEKRNGKKELVSEYGRGEIVGMMEALRGTSRSVSMLAVRDTELAKIPEGLLKHIRRRHPGVVSHLVSMMSDKLIGTMMSSKAPYRSHPAEILSHKQQMAEETKFAYGDVSNHLANLSTVAVLPVDEDVPFEKFTIELEHTLSAMCESVLNLSSASVKKRLGQSALDSSHEYRLTGWLAQQEDLHRIVLYQTDDHMSAWTQRCIRQSDAILIVANGDSEPMIGELERELENYSVRALKVLVLLHRPEVSQPTRTVEWLNMRGWLTEHLHIKGSKRLFSRTKKHKLDEYRERLSRREVDRFSDFSRLARFLTGKSVALVLGGGGARGISQIGIIKAILEAGVPIDLVGGTSIGAFVSALWASHRDLSIARSQISIFSDEMGSFMPKFWDLTYPITSMFSGSNFNNGIQMIFGETQIEDLWLPYYTITTDITSSRMRVHTDGLVWQYVRASMSFTPYLPPMCDPKDGHYLLDGCYMNNVPGDVARSRGASRVIAVDVGAATETNFTNYGDHLSGWWLLWKKWTGRWSGQVKIPDMNEIQSRLSYISCHYLMELVVNSDYCTYLRPPVTKYSTMDFAKWKELLEVGHQYGKEICTEEWGRKFWGDLYQHRASIQNDEFPNLKHKLSIPNLKANTSFTDLSEILRKKSPEEELIHFADVDFELGYESSPEQGTSLRKISTEPLSEVDEIASDVEGGLVYALSNDELDFALSSDDDDDEEDEDDDDKLMRRFSSQNVLSTSLR